MFRILFVLLVLTVPAMADPAPDPAFLQRAVAVLQQQRNAALDAQAIAEANRGALADEVTKLKAEIEDLKKSAKKPAQE